MPLAKRALECTENHFSQKNPSGCKPRKFSLFFLCNRGVAGYPRLFFHEQGYIRFRHEKMKGEAAIFSQAQRLRLPGVLALHIHRTAYQVPPFKKKEKKENGGRYSGQFFPDCNLPCK